MRETRYHHAPIALRIKIMNATHPSTSYHRCLVGPSGNDPEPVDFQFTVRTCYTRDPWIKLTVLVDRNGLEPFRLSACKADPGAHAHSPLTWYPVLVTIQRWSIISRLFYHWINRAFGIFFHIQTSWTLTESIAKRLPLMFVYGSWVSALPSGCPLDYPNFHYQYQQIVNEH